MTIKEAIQNPLLYDQVLNSKQKLLSMHLQVVGYPPLQSRTGRGSPSHRPLIEDQGLTSRFNYGHGSLYRPLLSYILQNRADRGSPTHRPHTGKSFPSVSTCNNLSSQNFFPLLWSVTGSLWCIGIVVVAFLAFLQTSVSWVRVLQMWQYLGVYSYSTFCTILSPVGNVRNISSFRGLDAST